MEDAREYAIHLLGMLPDDAVVRINQIMEQMIQKWDEDFTKVTPSEEKRIHRALAEMQHGIYFTHEEVFGERK